MKIDYAVAVWAVITDDEHLCFGPYASEEEAAPVARTVAHEHGLSAWCVELQPYEPEEDE
jgi:hypothetical protein